MVTELVGYMKDVAILVIDSIVVEQQLPRGRRFLNR